MKFLKTAALALALGVAAGGAQAANIVQTAASAGQFNTLLAAATAAGLAPALSGHTKLTVFAPTDAAFAALPAGTVENLLKPENKDKLVALLKYHVVAGEVYAKDIPVGFSIVPTLKEFRRQDHHHFEVRLERSHRLRQGGDRRYPDIEWRHSCHRPRVDADLLISLSSDWPREGMRRNHAASLLFARAVCAPVTLPSMLAIARA